MKWVWLSEGCTGSNIDAWIRIDFSRAALSRWHLISYATAVTRLLPFPKPTRFVDRSKAGNTMVLIFVSGSFLLPSVLRLLLELGFLVTEVYSCSSVMLVSFRSTFIRELVTRCFAFEWSVGPVLAYFRKPMLVTRCVKILLKFTHVRRNWSVYMILWSTIFHSGDV